MCNVNMCADDETGPRRYRMRARKDAVASTRERILRAAYALWAERPYDQVSVQSVADAAGVARQTVIRQFGTKDELALAVVDWQKPREDELRAADPGDVDSALERLVDRYESMGDANVRILELEGRVPAIDYLLEVARTGHRDWVERTLVPDAPPTERDTLVLALYAATDVTLWKLLRRDLGQDRDAVLRTMLRLVRGVLGPAASRRRRDPRGEHDEQDNEEREVRP